MSTTEATPTVRTLFELFDSSRELGLLLVQPVGSAEDAARTVVLARQTAECASALAKAVEGAYGETYGTTIHHPTEEA